MTALPPTTDDRIVWDTWLAQYRLPVLTVADELGTLKTISGAAFSTEKLAVEIGVDARALRIHLGMLAAMGFVERRGGLWRASAAARTWLHPNGEGYYGPAIHGFRTSQPLHEQLMATLKTGDRAEGHVSAAAEWELGEMSPELATHITAYMNAHSGAASRALPRLPLFGAVTSLLDVGGGSAAFSIQLAKAWPALRATVMEIEAVCAEADKYIAKTGVGAQVTTQTVNMFTQDWPTGHDAHFFSNIFHDWSDETCRLLARKSFEALPRGGMIMLHEMLMDDDGCGPLTTAAFSLLMLLGTKGRQYTLPELRSFLEDAGFVDVEAVTTGGGYYSLVTASKP